MHKNTFLLYRHSSNYNSGYCRMRDPDTRHHMISQILEELETFPANPLVGNHVYPYRLWYCDMQGYTNVVKQFRAYV